MCTKAHHSLHCQERASSRCERECLFFIERYACWERALEEGVLAFELACLLVLEQVYVERKEARSFAVEGWMERV